MKKKILFAVAVIGFLGTVIFFIADWKHKLSYSKCIGDYENTYTVNHWLEKGAAYEIGVNARGLPIFKDTKAALEQAKNDYKLGFDYLYQNTDVPVLSRNPSVCVQYFVQAVNINIPETIQDYDIIKKQCSEIVGFLSIYLNSFEPVPEKRKE